MAGAVGPEFRGARRRLIETLQANGITDLAVLRAFDLVPRHVFVPTGVAHRAYEDAALPIGNQQTISQPSVHARSLQELRLTGRERVLEIGTGSGYQTALLSNLAEQVFSIERVAALLDRAREVLAQLDVRNVSLLLGDGTLGWRDYAPYDGIVVGAASPDVPLPYAEQLGEGGRLVIPIGTREEQTLCVFTKRGGALERRDVGPVRFVPLLGAHGWQQ
ncbi:protein-L-isoaspartate(D-aspartate) O-methyltransferase [Roseisolibacter sp. H3M3-2]|uniref:protein-L-isoaspartate(D-aspartate) O-methyltransferase n=1 Tax=Roseisolibacter sp. H3M3-2 TaxID=3031323 RepID=UPI0023DBD630|nr:protein-L-isoaspartate(D-aspartate) O-methyltransferase [Roseisolibacter sp. H3M3-2]MDF1502632.1 protein-L-isoaspartate(D-aspartate) O-methyltransferase [Roseisolibacter sp. H3M3-2]